MNGWIYGGLVGREVQIGRFSHRQIGSWTSGGSTKRWSNRMSEEEVSQDARG